MAYFQQTGPASYVATAYVGGAWVTEEQHISPALGLLVHVVEQDRDLRRDDRLLPARLSYDIWGTVPIAEVETSVRVLRPGRTIELVEAVLTHAGRTIVTLRAWLIRQDDTSLVAGTHVPSIPPPAEVQTWDPTTVWPGGFIASLDLRRDQAAPGRALYWARTDLPIVEGQEVSSLARFAGLMDISNGMTVRVDPREVAFPNVDLTAHLMREPVGDWLGFDTSVWFGAHGVGVTTSVLHDEAGPLGTMSQILTIRPG